MNRRSRPQPPEICPVCGDEVPRNALACRECGADHDSGWRLEADAHDALGVSDDDFDYDNFVQTEFGSSIKPSGISAIWWITAVVVLVALSALYFFVH
ncbi:MAG: zinc ribbon domain-containing protein [Chthoniobacterales bacterium]